MALSKAERDADLWLYENAPYINGLSQAQFDRLPQDEKDRHVQIIMQVPATVLGYWKTCDVSVCRRARRCRGFLTKALRETGNYKIPYPPCVGPRGRHQAAMLEMLEQCNHLFDAEVRALLDQRKKRA